MKKYLLLATIVFSFSLSHVALAEDGDLEAIKNCLTKFGKHPFDEKNPSYTTISTKVKVLGVGEQTSDEIATDKPNLVLLKSNVTVLSKNNIRLMNPNGWYCIKGQVSVLGKSVIHIDCQSHLASSQDGVTVLGGGNNGVTVLGSTQVMKTGCTDKK